MVRGGGFMEHRMGDGNDRLFDEFNIQGVVKYLVAYVPWVVNNSP